jgi:hypothetical protein
LIVSAIGVALAHNNRLHRTAGFAVRAVKRHSSAFKEDHVTCECGCGEAPVRGSFLPGHDQRLRSSLEQLGILGMSLTYERVCNFFSPAS